MSNGEAEAWALFDDDDDGAADGAVPANGMRKEDGSREISDALLRLRTATLTWLRSESRSKEHEWLLEREGNVAVQAPSAIEQLAPADVQDFVRDVRKAMVGLATEVTTEAGCAASGVAVDACGCYARASRAAETAWRVVTIVNAAKLETTDVVKRQGAQALVLSHIVAAFIELTVLPAAGASMESIECHLFSSVAGVHDADGADSIIASAQRRIDVCFIFGGPKLLLAMMSGVNTTESGGLQSPERGRAGARAPLCSGHVDAISTVADEEWQLCPPIRHAIARRHESDVSKREFLSRHFEHEIPLVIEGAMRSWPAYTEWNDVHFWRDRFGHRLIPVEIGLPSFEGESEFWKEQIMTFANFLENYIEPSVEKLRRASGRKEQQRIATDVREICYCAQHTLVDQISDLRNYFTAPVWCGAVRRVNVWFGTHNTITPLHFDTYDNFLGQVVGYKYVRLYAKNESDRLYVKRPRDGDVSNVAAQGNISAVNIEHPSAARHPEFNSVPYLEAVLGPGDLLFIPAGCWHYLRSLTPSISINFWF